MSFDTSFTGQRRNPIPAGVEIFVPSHLSSTAILKQAFLGEPYFLPPHKIRLRLLKRRLLRRLLATRLVGQDPTRPLASMLSRTQHPWGGDVMLGFASFQLPRALFPRTEVASGGTDIECTMQQQNCKNPDNPAE